MKKTLLMLLLLGMLISAGCCCCFPGEKPKRSKKRAAYEESKEAVEQTIKIYLGMSLQRFLLSEVGQGAQRVFHNDKAQIKQEVWLYKDGTDEEQCFLFHDSILVEWQN